MADLIRIRCGALGSRTEMPTLQYDREKGCELGFRTDDKALYIGTANGNERLCGADDKSEADSKITQINSEIANIKARLEALENPSETPSE